MAMKVSREAVEHSTYDSIYLDDGTEQTVRTHQIVETETYTPVKMDFEVVKSRDEQHLVSGWASVSINADGSVPLDWDDDVIAPATLEKAAINFMKEFALSGEMHNGDSKGVVVESIVLTKEKQEAIGIPEGCVPEGWFITVEVQDQEVYKKVKDGTYKMFSIQGKAARTKL